MSGPWSVEADGYFVTLPEWIEESGISNAAFRLWCKLAKLASIHRGRHLPHTRLEIAALMGCSERTADRLLKELEDIEALAVQRHYDAETKRYYPSTYRVLTARPAWVIEQAEGVGQSMTPPPTDDPTPGAINGDASSTENKNPQSETAAPSQGTFDAPPSPRPPRKPRAVNGQNDSGLKPGAASTPQPPASAGSAEQDVARQIAERVSAAGRCVTDVRRQVVEYRKFLKAGVPPERIETAAMTLRSVSEGWMAGALDRLEKDRNGKPRPVTAPVVVAPPPETEEERAARIAAAAPAREQALAEVAARRAARAAAQTAEREAAAGLTLGAQAEEVAG